MSTYNACSGLIKIETAVPGTFVNLGEVTSWSLEENANIKSYFKLGTCEEQSSVTGTSRSVSIEGNFDFLDQGQDRLVPLVGTTCKIEIFPTGNTATHDKYAITGVIESITRSGSGDDTVTFSASIRVNAFVATAVP